MNHWEVRSAVFNWETRAHFGKLNTGDGDYDNCGIVDGGDAEFHIVLCSLGQSVREWMGWWSSVGIRESLGGQYLSSPDPFLFIRRGKNAIWSRKGKRFAIGNVEKSQNSPDFVCDQ